MIGADLTYQHISGSKYKVQYTLYRDCSGITAPSNMNLKVQSVTCSYSSFHSLELDHNSGQELNKFCEGTHSTCNGGTIAGVQAWNYSSEVDIPFACSDWNFSVTDCCRNTGITTISNPGSSNIFLHAFLNNTLGENSLGDFKQYAETQLIIGQEQVLHSGVTDVDGDSLVYSLSTPETGDGQLVNFFAPYHSNKPLGAEMNINSSTGEISIKPTHILNGIFSVLVQEYRNAVLIGSVSRDVQVSIIASSNAIPSLSGINGGIEKKIIACKASLLSFEIISGDADSEQQLSVFWNTNLPDARITQSNSLKPVIRVSWNPGQSTQNEYFLTVIIRDNACPFYAEKSETYIVVVNDFDVQLKATDIICEGDKTGAIQSIVNGGSLPYSYQWTEQNSHEGNLVSIAAGYYSVQVVDGNGCTVSSGIELKAVYQKPILNMQTNLNACVGKALLLEAGSDIHTYKWSDNSTGNSLAVNASGSYSVEVTNKEGCSTKAEVNIKFENCNGIDSKYDQSKQLSVYPNPVIDMTKLIVPASFDGAYSISLMDLGGRLIDSFGGQLSTTHEHSLNLSRINPGVYFFLIQSASDVQMIKFCKQ